MTAYEFAVKCMNIAQNIKTIYVMGCIGYPMTDGYKSRMYNHCPDYNQRPEKWKHISAAESDRFGFDCVCFLKSVYWGWDGNAKNGGADYASGGLPDIGADSMMTSAYCSDISTDMNNIQTGEILWCSGHVGVYLGCDRVAECTPAWRNCVQISTLKESVSGYGKQNWKKHGKLKVLTYDGRQITQVPGIVCKSDASNLASRAGATITGAAGYGVGGSWMFTERTTAPTESDESSKKYYFDDNPYHKSGYGMPNCTAYAFGRFYEILGTMPKLSYGNAEDWYGHEDGYERGSTPRPGAVICWRKGVACVGADGAGHVGIVERVNEDGSIITSESGWQDDRTIGEDDSRWWWRKTRNNDGNWGSSSEYTFQGFIYNPAVTYSSIGYAIKDSLSYFIEAAKNTLSNESSNNLFSDIADSAVNFVQDITTSFTHGFLDKLSDPSLKFIYQCAGSIEGLVGGVFPESTCRNMLVEDALEQKMGQWLGGPANGYNRTPHPGDIIYVRTSSVGTRVKQYDCDRVGIVTTIMTGHEFEYTYGTRDGVKSSKLSFDSDQIAGYYRPRWSLVNANIYNQIGISLTLSIYNELSGRDDAAIREIGYLSRSLEPSIESSNMRFSVINYTSGISALFLAWGGSQYGSAYPNVSYSDLVLDGFSSVQCAIIEQLMSYGLNAAISIGILANIFHESRFNPAAVGDNGHAFGLCQWNWYGEEFKQKVPDWKTNVSGQIAYLWDDLQGRHIGHYNKFKDCPNSLQGCRDTAYLFCVHYERPQNKEYQGQRRADTAQEYWNQIITQLGVLT